MSGLGAVDWSIEWINQSMSGLGAVDWSTELINQSINQSMSGLGAGWVERGIFKGGGKTSQSQDCSKPGRGKIQRCLLVWSVRLGIRASDFKRFKNKVLGTSKGEYISSQTHWAGSIWYLRSSQGERPSQTRVCLHTEGGVAWSQYRRPVKGQEATSEDTVAGREASVYMLRTLGWFLCQTTTPIEFTIITTNHLGKATTDLTELFAISISFSTLKAANSQSIN